MRKVSGDPEEVLRHFLFAAHYGMAQAYIDIGKLYARGEILPSDLKEGMNYLKLVAKLGCIQGYEELLNYIEPASKEYVLLLFYLAFINPSYSPITGEGCFLSILGQYDPCPAIEFYRSMASQDENEILKFFRSFPNASHKVFEILNTEKLPLLVTKNSYQLLTRIFIEKRKKLPPLSQCFIAETLGQIELLVGNHQKACELFIRYVNPVLLETGVSRQIGMYLANNLELALEVERQQIQLFKIVALYLLPNTKPASYHVENEERRMKRRNRAYAFVTAVIDERKKPEDMINQKECVVLGNVPDALNSFGIFAVLPLFGLPRNIAALAAEYATEEQTLSHDEWAQKNP